MVHVLTGTTTNMGNVPYAANDPVFESAEKFTTLVQAPSAHLALTGSPVRVQLKLSETCSEKEPSEHIESGAIPPSLSGA